MAERQQVRVLFATLTECASARGTTYLRGWAGASNLVAFRGDDDEQGRPTWQLFLVERQPKDGKAPARRPPPADHTRDSTSGTVVRNGAAYRAPRRESERARQERVASEVAARHGVRSDDDLDDRIPF